MVGGVERSFGTSVPFLIILYTKKIKNQGVLRKKSNTRSYFFEISQPSRICAVASPVFYFTFILYCLAKALPRQKTPGQRSARCKRRKAFPAHAGVGVRPWFLLGQFYLTAHAGGLSAAPRSPVLLRRIFARRDKKRLPPLREPESDGALKRRNAALTGIRRVLPLVIILLYFLN